MRSAPLPQNDTSLAHSIDPALCSVDCGEPGVTQGFDIAHGWLAEEAAVLAVELADAFIANFVCSAGGVDPVHEHALACDLQTELLLILERAHGGQRPELVVEGGYAHARDLGEFFHAQGLGEVGAKPGDGACGSVTQIARGCDGAEAFALRSAEDPVEDLALDQVA